MTANLKHKETKKNNMYHNDIWYGLKFTDDNMSMFINNKCVKRSNYAIEMETFLTEFF